MDNLINLVGVDIAKNIKDNLLNFSDVFNFFKKRIDRLNPSINAFVDVYEDYQIEGDSSLAGIPIAIKDNICIRNKKITCASKILSTHISVYDATVITKLKKAGLAIIGTTNMDEFAFGSSTENSYYGATKNPWDITRVPGGSSGGSAAAVA
ncbi:MAG: amidase family protein, partial [Candidatus Omnitrophica bacterium]|nr:amidase family protein [Candidatus Omnitrophota bacterium]